MFLFFLSPSVYQCDQCFYPPNGQGLSTCPWEQTGEAALKKLVLTIASPRDRVSGGGWGESGEWQKPVDSLTLTGMGQFLGQSISSTYLGCTIAHDIDNVNRHGCVELIFTWLLCPSKWAKERVSIFFKWDYVRTQDLRSSIYWHEW